MSISLHIPVGHLAGPEMALSDSIGVAEESWRWHDPFSAWYEKYSQLLVFKHRRWQSEARISTVIPCPDISKAVNPTFLSVIFQNYLRYDIKIESRLLFRIRRKGVISAVM